MNNNNTEINIADIPASEGSAPKKRQSSRKKSSAKTASSTKSAAKNTQKSSSKSSSKKTAEKSAAQKTASKSKTAKADTKQTQSKSSRGRKPKAQQDDGKKLRVISLGGLQEIGKNLTVIEYENDIMIIDCGMTFPNGDMLGVDMVIPDITYLKKNINKVKGIVITHGHEDHVGGLPNNMRDLNMPIYCTA